MEGIDQDDAKEYRERRVLSARQLEAVEWRAMGLGSGSIAKKMGLHRNTVLGWTKLPEFEEVLAERKAAFVYARRARQNDAMDVLVGKAIQKVAESLDSNMPKDAKLYAESLRILLDQQQKHLAGPAELPSKEAKVDPAQEPSREDIRAAAGLGLELDFEGDDVEATDEEVK